MALLGAGGAMLLATLIALAMRGPGWPYFFALGLVGVAASFILGLQRHPR